MDGLDVVAVQVAYEHAVVPRVVLGPEPRRMQHLGAEPDGGIVNGVDGCPVRCGEGDVHFAAAVADQGT